MGFFAALLGNASQASVKEAKKKYAKLLAIDEDIVVSFKLIRDELIFTKKRLILVDVQGISGKKIEVQSIPYRSIVRFAIETAGFFDLDAELKIWVQGSGTPIVKTFNQTVNIYRVQAVLANAISLEPQK